MMKTKTFLKLVLTGLLALPLRVAGQEELIDVTETFRSSQSIPISLSGFSGEVQSVLRFDLEVAGFQIVSPESARYNVTGSDAGAVRGQLTERSSQAALLSNEYSGGSPRTQAHTFADDIIAKLTGAPGISRSKIVFKGETGDGNSEVYISDYDGANIFPITRDGTVVAAPTWAPGKRVVYYTSYKSGYPDIYSHNLDTAERRTIANYPGLNTSAAVSPDGRYVAMILSKFGSPDLYVANADGTNLRQLTTTRQDESSPCWSPDGRTICYVSRATGRAALYTISVDGGAPRPLVTRGAGTVTEPDWSPDGKTIVFTVLRRDFEICTIPAQGGSVTTLAQGEDPSWAPNSRTIIFTRRAKGKRILSLLDVKTKRVKDVAQSLGSCSQPSWAK